MLFRFSTQTFEKCFCSIWFEVIKFQDCAVYYFEISHRTYKQSHSFIDDSSLFHWWIIDVSTVKQWCLLVRNHWFQCGETLITWMNQWYNIKETSMFSMLDVEMMHHWCFRWPHYWIINTLHQVITYKIEGFILGHRRIAWKVTSMTDPP